MCLYVYQGVFSPYKFFGHACMSVRCIRLDYASRPNSIRWSLSPGTSNCSWTSCREGCTKELYDCTQIRVNYKLPENVSEGSDEGGGAVGGVEDDEESKRMPRYERSLGNYGEYAEDLDEDFADEDDTGLPKPFPTGTMLNRCSYRKELIDYNFFESSPTAAQFRWIQFQRTLHLSHQINELSLISLYHFDITVKYLWWLK